MNRDHRKLRVFHQAHTLTLAIYQHTPTSRATNGSACVHRYVAPPSQYRATLLKETREVVSGTT